MMERKTWVEFQKAGLLWWVNRILHTFRWSIVIEQGADGSVGDVYPARTSWLGFDGETNDKMLKAFQENTLGHTFSRGQMEAMQVFVLGAHQNACFDSNPPSDRREWMKHMASEFDLGTTKERGAFWGALGLGRDDAENEG